MLLLRRAVRRTLEGGCRWSADRRARGHRDHSVCRGPGLLFGFGNVWCWPCTSGCWCGWLRWWAPAVNLSVVGLLLGTRYLDYHDGRPEQLRPARRLLVFSSVMTLALNAADPLVAGLWGRAAFKGPVRQGARCMPLFLRSPHVNRIWLGCAVPERVLLTVTTPREVRLARRVMPRPRIVQSISGGAMATVASDTGTLVNGTRKQRGWGQLRPVNETCRAAQRRGQALLTDLSVRRRTVSWENGHCQPDEFYGLLLCEALGLTAGGTGPEPRRTRPGRTTSGGAVPTKSGRGHRERRPVVARRPSWLRASAPGRACSTRVERHVLTVTRRTRASGADEHAPGGAQVGSADVVMVKVTSDTL